MVRYLFYTIGDLTYQSPLVSVRVNSSERRDIKCLNMGKVRKSNTEAGNATFNANIIRTCNRNTKAHNPQEARNNTLSGYRPL